MKPMEELTEIVEITEKVDPDQEIEEEVQHLLSTLYLH